MITIGLTGPSGAGKGMLSKILNKHGIPCLDTDLVSRRVCEAGMPCTLELARAFGDGIINADGTLDRKALARAVFLAEDKDSKTQKLNSITHRYILAEADKWLKKQADLGYMAAVVDAPVLFESGYNKKCDYIIGVLAKRETRIARIKARDSIDRELAEKRIAAQKDDVFFQENCSLVLYNDAGVQELESAALPYIEKLKLGVIPE
ncbi:MAG: dephospho-CoA kinase [Clostridia bacterium]|nr:dephospho-CoA kinase [Clostridia bacterium]